MNHHVDVELDRASCAGPTDAMVGMAGSLACQSVSLRSKMQFNVSRQGSDLLALRICSCTLTILNTTRLFLCGC